MSDPDSRTAWCSWCTKNVAHELKEEGRLFRSVYECSGCGRRSLPCRACDVAMTKGGYWDDERCLVCCADKETWEDADGRFDGRFDERFDGRFDERFDGCADEETCVVANTNTKTETELQMGRCTLSKGP